MPDRPNYYLNVPKEVSQCVNLRKVLWQKSGGYIVACAFGASSSLSASSRCLHLSTCSQ